LVRSSEAFISIGKYPQCFAMTWAKVVLPTPGGPCRRTTYGAGIRAGEREGEGECERKGEGE